MSLKKYTVILLYPDYLCDDVPYGQEVCVARRTTAEDPAGALAEAQKEAFMVTREEGNEGGHAEDPEDFSLVVMFEGHHDPVLFGWQL